MTREEIKNTPEIVDFMLDKSVIADSRIKLHKRLEEICELAIKVLEKEKPETVTEFADRCRECGARYGKLLKTINRAHWIDNNNGTISCSHCSTWFYKDGRYAYMRHCPYCNTKMAESEKIKDE